MGPGLFKLAQGKIHQQGKVLLTVLILLMAACWAKSVPLNTPSMKDLVGIYLWNMAQVNCDAHKNLFIKV